MSGLFDVKNFVSERDNVLIAPAGFGKTHTISECLKHTEGRQLILTHTQAGVASIKEKLQKSSISKDSYNVETISSFAQRYVFAFDNSTNIPNIEDPDNFYPFLIDRAREIFLLKPVQDVIRLSYTGLFVDEYQDCTLKQHDLILILADILPSHILGDPLQGIFWFAGELVDLDNPVQMGRFNTRHKLETPHRWINGGNEQLGTELLQIRENLISKLEIDLTKYPSIEFKQGAYADHYNYIINILTSGKSVLVIHPSSGQIPPRQKFVADFKYIPILIESLDHKDFYNWAKHFDDKTKPFSTLFNDFITSQFSNLANWYNKDTQKFKKKNDPSEESKLIDIKNLHNELQTDYSLIKTKELIHKTKNLSDVNCTRRDLLNSLCVSMENAHYSSSSVLEAMQNHRNTIRKMGRKLYGRCIGTTLLTKGLEFDTVIVLDANKFKDPKNFYVAISRCTKRLVILADDNKLNPYSN
jgi:DNA helicase-2/ATP-dependent DNA helicase PcrA